MDAISPRIKHIVVLISIDVRGRERGGEREGERERGRERKGERGREYTVMFYDGFSNKNIECKLMHMMYTQNQSFMDWAFI